MSEDDLTCNELAQRCEEAKATAARLREKENRLIHIKKVLLAIRNVNQLIVKVDDTEELITKACQNLTESQGYHHAWIALIDQKTQEITLTASSGFTGEFQAINETLMAGEYPHCMRLALKQDQLIVIKNPPKECPDCPLSHAYSGRAGLSRRLAKKDNVFGLLSVSVPQSYADDPELQSLFNGLVEDLSFAVDKIESERLMYQLEEIALSIPQTIALVSRDYIYLAVNDFYCQIFDVPQNQIIGHRVTEFIDQTLFETEIKPRLDRCMSGKSDRYELHIDLPGMGKRWLEVEYIPYRKHTGQIIGVLVHGIDITDRKRAQDQIQALARFPAENPNPVMRVASDGTLLHANSAALTALSSLNLQTGKPVSTLLSEPVQSCLEKCLPVSLDIELEDRVFSFSITPIKDSGYANIYGKDVTEERQATQALKRFEWLTEKEQVKHNGQIQEYQPIYGDITEQNTARIIIDSVGKEALETMANDIMTLLDTSLAVYEKNGDYAFGFMASDWCRFLFDSSRRLCDTDDNKEALQCGKWLCHENCWHDSAKSAIKSGQPTDIQCVGKIHLYSEPVYAGDEIVGAVNIGYGDPPSDPEVLKQLADKYYVSVGELKKAADSYKPRPTFVVEVAKRHVRTMARMIGEIVARKKTEIQIRAQSEQLNHAVQILNSHLQNTPVAVIEWDPDFRVIRWSGQSEKVFGWKESDVRGKKPEEWRFVHEEDAASVHQIMQELIFGDCPSNISYNRNHTASGRTIFCEWYNSALMDRDGNLLSILSLVLDITERKLAEQQILQLNRLYAVLSNISNSIIHIRDRQQLFQEVCRIAVEVGRLRMAAVMLADTKTREALPVATAGRTAEYFETVRISIDDVPHGRSTIGTAIRKGRHDICDDIANDPRMSPWREAALERGYLSTASFPLKVNGLTIGVLVFFANRTGFFDTQETRLLDELAANLSYALEFLQQEEGRKKAEAQLRESEEKYRLLADNTVDCIWQMSLDRVFSYVNPACYQLFGYTQKEMIGTNLREYCDEKNYKYMLDIISQALAAPPGESAVTFEAELLKRDGTSLQVEISGKVVRDTQGHPVSLQGVTRDITVRKRDEKEKQVLENQLRQAQKMEAIGNLAGGVAHDFNNILQAMLGYCTLLKRGIDKSSEYYECVQELLAGTERAQTLTRQLLTFSRREVSQFRDINLNEVVSNLVKMISRTLGEQIETEMRLCPRDLAIHADLGQIEQVLMNLCVNARDAMHSGGRLIIETEFAVIDEAYCKLHSWAVPGRYALLAVSDTGCGMDDVTKEQVFEPFFTTKEVGKGTGLGLSTVYGIVKKHEGMIHVYSEPGQGSTFRVYIPLSKTFKTTPVTALEKDIAPPGGKETILLAEDDIAVRRLTIRVLRDAGYHVIPAADGQEACDIIEKESKEIDLALLDVVMPKVSGKAVHETYLDNKPHGKVVFISGYSKGLIENEIFDQEKMQFLQKPFTPESLLLAIRNTLDA